MILHFHLTSVLIIIWHQISFLVQPRSLLRRLRLDLKNTRSHRKHDVDPRSASDQYSNESNELRIASSKSKKHADKSKHKVRSRYVSFSSGEDHSSVARHRSSKPSGTVSDQDQPHHDPDPPWLCLTFPLNTLKRWTLSGASFPSLTPGSLCLSPQLQLWVWMIKKGCQELRPRGPLCFHSAQLSKMPLISLNMISRPLIYLRVNTSNLLLPLQSGYKGGQPCYEEKINPLGLLWTRFPYQFLRNWSTKLGKTYPHSTLLLPSPRLHLLAMPLLRSVNIA